MNIIASEVSNQSLRKVRTNKTKPSGAKCGDPVLGFRQNWPQSILTRFATIPTNPRENDYYSSYNKLLNFLFPPDGPFTVGPQTHPIADSREFINFLVEYQVFSGDVPVFILEIKTGPKLGLVSA